jgi:hypothetical protein
MSPRKRSHARLAEHARVSDQAAASEAQLVLGDADTSLLDVVDNVLNKGVVLSGDITIGLAQVDLIYARLSLLLCAADRILPREQGDLIERRDARKARRARLERA